MPSQHALPDIQHLRTALATLSDAVVHQMSSLVQAADTANRVELQAIVKRDHDIDDLELSLDTVSRAFLEMRAPLGPDFRYALGALDIARNLERVGDCIEYVARHLIEAPTLDKDFPIAWDQLRDMLARCNSILGSATLSWKKSDAVLARSLPEQDDAVDALQSSLRKAIIDEVRAGRVDVQLGMLVLLVTNKLESLADIACHIAETVVMVVAAQQIRHGESGGKG